MTETEYPEDEQRDEQEEPVEPVSPAAEVPAFEVADELAAVGEEPAGSEQPAAAAEQPAAAVEQPAAAVEQPAAAVEQPAATVESDAAVAPPAVERPGAASQPTLEDQPELEEEVELAPRRRPEIPGADLIPDIVPEGEEFLDAEARAAAEAEAEAAAVRAAEEQDEEPRPIADAAINLAAGARYAATGKRKTAVARVILKPGTGTYAINAKSLDSYFPRETLQRVIRQPLDAVGYESRMDVVARMHGGGVSAQAGALRHGISRALIDADPNLRGELKRRGFLTRDPRVKERKKAGLKKARKRPQFSKR